MRRHCAYGPGIQTTTYSLLTIRRYRDYPCCLTYRHDSAWIRVRESNAPLLLSPS